MTKIFTRRVSSVVFGGLLVAAAFAATPASAAEHGAPIARQGWTFGGWTGYFDNEQLRRGYMVYKNVCSACHGMRQLYYRNLSEAGGPEFSPERVKEFAAEAQVTDGPNDEGEMFTRNGLPADHFVSPYPNDKAAAAAQGGAVPPDLSLMAKARSVATAGPWYLEPFHWLYDIGTSYQEGGPDYIHGILTGYHEAPEGMKVVEGMYYNAAFPGHQIAMPPPLSDGLVEYADGTPGTVENYAHDVAAFLMWTAEPKLEERKRMGLKVMVYLLILSVILYLSKATLWRRIPH